MVALQSLIPEIPNRLPRWARLYLLFNSDFVDFLLETKVGRHRRPNFVIFVVSGAYIIDWWVVVVSSRNFYLEHLLNRIYCVAGFIQRWGTQGESKISPYCF